MGESVESKGEDPICGEQRELTDPQRMSPLRTGSRETEEPTGGAGPPSPL